MAREAHTPIGYDPFPSLSCSNYFWFLIQPPFFLLMRETDELGTQGMVRW